MMEVHSWLVDSLKSGSMMDESAAVVMMIGDWKIHREHVDLKVYLTLEQNLNVDWFRLKVDQMIVQEPGDAVVRQLNVVFEFCFSSAYCLL